MSYKEWLYTELENEGVIDTDEWDLDDITTEALLESTDLDSCDLDNYTNQFKEYCSRRGITPVWDLDESN